MPHNSEADGLRVLTICNACRYCEGYCAVFPALERRTIFSHPDLIYLANLCHNCAECYYACPYTPPHDFAVNVPKLLAEARALSYRGSAWPHWYGGGILPIFTLCLFAFLLGVRPGFAAPADFYAVISHSRMIAIFGAAAAFVMAMLISGVLRFWRTSGPPAAPSSTPILGALRDAMTIKYLAGGTSDSRARRWFHHFTFYGFLLCFASTTAAAVDHYLLGLRAPYPIFSVPVILGTLGGIGLLIGPAGLYLIKRHRDPVTVDPRQDGADLAFLAMLFLTSLTGLLLLILRATPQMSILLRVHLGIVLALFLTMPYSKFVHGLYRFAALLRYAFEAASSARREAR